jgi:nucleoside-diphosphate-sugar epimerase
MIFILGAGFIGKSLALSLKQFENEVMVSKRSSNEDVELHEHSVPIFQMEVGQTKVQHKIEVEKLVVAYPLRSKNIERDEMFNHVKWIVDVFESSKLKQVILLSSTSVYPENSGEVDENCFDFREGSGLIQWQFEEELRKCFGSRLVVLRLAGLIGATRLPGRFLSGKKNLPNPKSPVNLVHQNDVVRFATEILNRNITNEIFNLCHDYHPRRIEYYNKMAFKLYLQPPTFSDEQIANPKMVLNTKSKGYFGFEYLWNID